MTFWVVGSFIWNPGAGATSVDGVLAGVQSLALLMELDLAIGIGEDLPKVDRISGASAASPVEV